VDEMMAYYDHTIFDGELKSYSLDFVSHHELKTGKVKYTGTTGELMDRDEDKLAEYNVWDMLLVEWIAEVKELWDYKEYVRRQMGLPLDECGSMSTPIHTLLVRRSMLKGMAFANRNFDEKTKFKGAVVFPAIYGLYNAMASLDFKSLYPIIMIMWNLSLETIIRKPSKYPREYLKKCIRTPPTDISPEGLYIKPKSEQVGFLCEILTEFIQERDKAKAKALKYRDMHGKGDSRTKAAEQAQKFEKAKTNSVYGELKKYILALGDAVTAIARGAIQHASDLAESEELSKELIKMFEASI
jgi:DNA polymerase I